MRNKSLIITFILLFLTIISEETFAQNTMYYMDCMPQQQENNPAFIPMAKFHIGLPAFGGISTSAYNSDFNYNELDYFINNIDNDDYNPDDFINSIGETDELFADINMNILSFGFRLKDKGYLSFNYSLKNSININTSSDFVYLLTDYDDLSLDRFPLTVDGINISFCSYINMGITYSKKITDNLTIGITPSLNYGLGGIKTKDISYTVSIDEEEEDYHETFGGEARIGLPVEINPEAVNEGELDLDEGFFSDDWENDLSAGNFFKNASLSLDIGATYQFDKWLFSASVLNLGNIKWKQNGYQMNGKDDIIKIQEENVTFNVPTRLYVGASRKLSSNWNCGVLVNSTFYESATKTLATASLNGSVGKILSTSVSYSVGYGEYNNIGLGARVKFLPGTYLYLITDNLVQAFSIKEAQRSTFTFGIYFMLRKKNEQKG